MKTIHKKQWRLLFPFVLLLLFTILLFHFPPTGDDWILIGKEYDVSDHVGRQLQNWQSQNGRILGNLFFTVLVHPVPRLISKMLALAGFLFAAYRLHPKYRPESAMLLLSVLLFLPIEMLREVWVWNAGFFNYVPPVVILSLLLVVWKKEQPTACTRVLLFFGTLASCLFLENITVYLLAVGLVLPVYIARKHRRRIKSALAVCFGSIAGAALMFSSPSYLRVADASDPYRTAGVGLTGILATAAENWTESFVPYLLGKNHFLVGLFLVIATTAVLTGKNKKVRIPCAVLWITGIAMSVFGTMELPPPPVVTVSIHLCFYAALWLLGRRMLSGSSLGLYSFLLLSVPVLLAPLLAVQPVGARNFFAPTIFLTLAATLLLRGLPPLSKRRSLIVPVGLLLIFIARWSVLYPVYADNFRVHRMRVELAEQAVRTGETAVAMPPFPHPDHVHGHDPSKMGFTYFNEHTLDIRFFEEEIP